MKKNLRNVLTLALGFVTIFATAQDWDADSRTRVDMGGDNDRFMTGQRTSLGVSWGGDGWGINVGAMHNMNLDNTANHTMDWYEANASADLMGFATVTVGRQVLDYGSGLIIGSNDWGLRPNTYDGGIFDINTDIVDVAVGYYRNNLGEAHHETENNMLVNVSKSDGDWSINGLYVSTDNGYGVEATAMGIDAGYSMMSGALDLSISYNTAKSSDADPLTADVDMDMMSLGLSYNVSDDLSISASRTTAGDGGFNLGTGNYGMGTDSWDTHGNMGYLSANDQDLSVGISYAMGDFSIGASMHKVTNDTHKYTDMTEYDRSVTEFNIGYTMSDNANVGIKYATDEGSRDDLGNSALETKYMWLTLNVTP